VENGIKDCIILMVKLHTSAMVQIVNWQKMITSVLTCIMCVLYMIIKN